MMQTKKYVLADDQINRLMSLVVVVFSINIGKYYYGRGLFATQSSKKLQSGSDITRNLIIGGLIIGIMSRDTGIEE